MYNTRLEQLGADVSTCLHTTELKYRILANIPDMQAHRHGRDVLLAFNDDIGVALKKACETDYDDEAIIISQEANIVRKDLLNMDKSDFNGTFGMQCQQESVPQSLTTLIAMILGGPNILTQS